MILSVWKFINYWYFRYLLVTELYMVEKWEQIMMHVVLFLTLSLVSLFNTSVTLGLVTSITRSFFKPYEAAFTLDNLNNSMKHSEF